MLVKFFGGPQDGLSLNVLGPLPNQMQLSIPEEKKFEYVVGAKPTYTPIRCMTYYRLGDKPEYACLGSFKLESYIQQCLKGERVMEPMREVPESSIKMVTVSTHVNIMLYRQCQEHFRKLGIDKVARAIAEKLFEFDKVLVTERDDLGIVKVLAQIEVIVPKRKPEPKQE